MNWKITISNRETLIVNGILIIASIIAMISAVKLSSYGFGILSIILSLITIELKY